MQASTLTGKSLKDYATVTPQSTTPDLQRINGNIQHLIANIDESNTRLADFIARVYGTSDGMRGGDNPAPQPAGVMGSLDRQMAELGEIADRYRNMTERLASLA